MNYKLEGKQDAMDDGSLHFQNRAFTKKSTFSGYKTLPAFDRTIPITTGSQGQHLKLIDIVRKYPPDLFSKLILRDERLLSLPRYIGSHRGRCARLSISNLRF